MKHINIGDIAYIRPNFCERISLKIGRDGGPDTVVKPTYDSWFTEPFTVDHWKETAGQYPDATYIVTAHEVFPVVDRAVHPTNRSVWIKIVNRFMRSGWLREDWLRKVD